MNVVLRIHLHSRVILRSFVFLSFSGLLVLLFSCTLFVVFNNQKELFGLTHLGSIGNSCSWWLIIYIDITGKLFFTRLITILVVYHVLRRAASILLIFIKHCLLSIFVTHTIVLQI